MGGLGLFGIGLVLIVLETIVTSTENSASGASRILSFLQEPAKLAGAWMDPSVPLLPDRTVPSSPASSSTSASSTSSTAAQTITNAGG